VSMRHRPLGSVVNLNWGPQEQPLTSEINNSNNPHSKLGTNLSSLSIYNNISVIG